MRKPAFRYLVFVGPGQHKIHPETRALPCTYLSSRHPKLVAIGHNQQAALREALAQ